MPGLRMLCLGASALVMASAVAPSAHAQLPASNPFAEPSSLPYQAPPFDRIKDSDYEPAIEEGMRQQISEAKQGLFDDIVARAVKRGEPVSMSAASIANEVSSALFFNRVAMGSGEIDEAFVLHMVDDVILPLLRC